MTLRLQEAPGALAVSLAEMKLHLRVDIEDDDALIEALIRAATSHVEQITGRRLVSQRWTKSIDQFPAGGSAIELRLPPVQSVDAIRYFDGDGVEQYLDSTAYEIDSQSQTAWLIPAYGYVWPAARERANAVTVEFTTGYGEASAVPDSLKAAVKLLVGNLYENREATTDKQNLTVVPFAVEALLSPYIVMAFV